jgi:processive 1,2-diacylglycerol beta-glucosyltransferase
MVVTDYYANRMWLSPAVRHLFVASETIKKAFQSDHASIIVSGIPVNPRFFKPKNIPELRRKLGLEDAQPVILILSGGTGLIDITAATEQILNNFPAAAVVAIAGKDNTEVFNKLETLAPGRDSYRVFEFIDTIDEWMAVASVVVTKPGGLTTSEVLYLKKPLLMINPLPGQEEKNAAFVTDHNYGRLVAEVHELPDLISKILSEPHFLNTPPDLPNPNETILSAQ